MLNTCESGLNVTGALTWRDPTAFTDSLHDVSAFDNALFYYFVRMCNVCVGEGVFHGSKIKDDAAKMNNENITI